MGPLWQLTWDGQNLQNLPRQARTEAFRGLHLLLVCWRTTGPYRLAPVTKHCPSMRGVSAFQRLATVLGATPSERLAASIIGVGGCRLRQLSTTGAALQGKVGGAPS